VNCSELINDIIVNDDVSIRQLFDFNVCYFLSKCRHTFLTSTLLKLMLLWQATISGGADSSVVCGTSNSEHYHHQSLFWPEYNK
jgi:hypothetical protein